MIAPACVASLLILIRACQLYLGDTPVLELDNSVALVCGEQVVTSIVYVVVLARAVRTGARYLVCKAHQEQLSLVSKIRNS